MKRALCCLCVLWLTWGCESKEEAPARTITSSVEKATTATSAPSVDRSQEVVYGLKPAQVYEALKEPVTAEDITQFKALVEEMAATSVAKKISAYHTGRRKNLKAAVDASKGDAKAKPVTVDKDFDVRAAKAELTTYYTNRLVPKYGGLAQHKRLYKLHALVAAAQRQTIKMKTASDASAKKLTSKTEAWRTNFAKAGPALKALNGQEGVVINKPKTPEHAAHLLVFKRSMQHGGFAAMAMLPEGSIALWSTTLDEAGREELMRYVSTWDAMHSDDRPQYHIHAQIARALLYADPGYAALYDQMDKPKNLAPPPRQP